MYTCTYTFTHTYTYTYVHTHIHIHIIMYIQYTHTNMHTYTNTYGIYTMSCRSVSQSGQTSKHVYTWNTIRRPVINTAVQQQGYLKWGELVTQIKYNYNDHSTMECFGHGGLLQLLYAQEAHPVSSSIL